VRLPARTKARAARMHTTCSDTPAFKLSVSTRSPAGLQRESEDLCVDSLQHTMPKTKRLGSQTFGALRPALGLFRAGCASAVLALCTHGPRRPVTSTRPRHSLRHTLSLAHKSELDEGTRAAAVARGRRGPPP
jgi:hypothetical protein